MNTLIRTMISMGISLLATMAIASNGDANIAQGKVKSVACAACHGSDGNSMNPIWPSLAGQHARYSYRQLVEFKKGASGKRQNVLMVPIIANLTDQDFKNLSAYFASLTPKLNAASRENLDLGRQLYRGGDLGNHITACISCHGPRGLGNAEAGFPRLGGQNAAYVAKTLKDYRSGARANSPNGIMEMITERMTDKEIEAVANYIQGLV